MPNNPTPKPGALTREQIEQIMQAAEKATHQGPYSFGLDGLDSSGNVYFVDVGDSMEIGYNGGYDPMMIPEAFCRHLINCDPQTILALCRMALKGVE